MEPLKDIPLKQFFSYRDVNGHYYGFHIESAVQCWTKCDSRNPFTRQLLPKPVVDAIRNCHRLVTPPPINQSPNTPVEWAEWDRMEREDQAAWERKWHEAHVPTKAFQVFHDFYLFSGFHIEESWFLELGVQKLSHFYSYLETLCFKLSDVMAYELSCIATLYGLVQSHKEIHEAYFRRDWSRRELEGTQKDILFTLEEWVDVFKDPAEKTSMVMIILKALAVCSREAQKALPIFAPADREQARRQETWLRMEREIREYVPYELARYGITRAHLERDREMRRRGYL